MNLDLPDGKYFFKQRNSRWMIVTIDGDDAFCKLERKHKDLWYGVWTKYEEDEAEEFDADGIMRIRYGRKYPYEILADTRLEDEKEMFPVFDCHPEYSKR